MQSPAAGAGRKGGDVEECVAMGPELFSVKGKDGERKPQGQEVKFLLGMGGLILWSFKAKDLAL